MAQRVPFIVCALGRNVDPFTLHSTPPVEPPKAGLSFWSMVNRSNRALVKMRFDADVNQHRESGCDEDGENNGHITALKRVFMVN
jgi:hypothetical protein